MENLKEKYNQAIDKEYQNFIDTQGGEYEEVFSRRLFNLFNSYEKKFGEKHSLEHTLNNTKHLNEKFAKEKDRMRELVEMFSQKNEIQIPKEEKDSKNENLDKEYSRLKNLSSGQANSTFKENYMSSNDYGMGGKQGRTVNSIIDQMYDNPSIAYKPIRQPLQAEEGVKLAIKRTLNSGAPVKDMGFYDEVNWHLMSLGFPAKNPLDIKSALLKLTEK